MHRAECLAFRLQGIGACPPPGDAGQVPAQHQEKDGETRHHDRYADQHPLQEGERMGRGVGMHGGQENKIGRRAHGRAHAT